MAEVSLVPSSSEPSRARTLLKEMKAKRESLLSNHPELQRRQSSSVRKRPSVGRTNSNRSTRASQDIIKDMKKQKASLSAVLDAARRNNPPKKGHGSVAPSTAPTAASTRSFVDDASLMMYSVDSRRGSSTSVNESTFEFIIDADADDSTYESTSTNEDIQKAVGDIYSIVIPKALSALHSSRSGGEDDLASTRTSSRGSQRGGGGGGGSSASPQLDQLSTIGERDTERDTSEQDTSHDEKEMTKWRKTTISPPAPEKTSAAQTRDMLRKSLSDLKSMRRTPPTPPLRRHRPQSDDSEGSLPPPRSSSSSSASLSPRQGSRFSVATTPPSQISPGVPSQPGYVVGTKFRRGRRRKVVAKPTSLYQGPVASVTPSRTPSSCRIPASPVSSGNCRMKLFDPQTPELKDEPEVEALAEANSFEDKLEAAIRELQAPIVIDLGQTELSRSPRADLTENYDEKVANAIKYVKEPKKLDLSAKKSYPSPMSGRATSEFERRISEAIQNVKVPDIVDMSPEEFVEEPSRPKTSRNDNFEETKPALTKMGSAKQFPVENSGKRGKDAFEGKIINVDLDGTDVDDDLTWGYSLADLPDEFNADDVYYTHSSSPGRGVDDSASVTAPEKKTKKKKSSRSKKRKPGKHAGGLYFIAVQSGMEDMRV